MIGNDLVDLMCAKHESNWQRPRFLEKLFTPTEIAYIKNATTPSLAIWSLWSKKESVYKIIARLEKRRFFAPKKIECLFITTPTMVPSQDRPIVVYQNQTFRTWSFFKAYFIHTVAYQASTAPFILMEEYYIEQKCYATQSQIVREKLLVAYARYTHLEQAFLSIQKDANGIPSLYFKNKKQSSTVSLSHHGNYVGFAITIDNLAF